MGFLRSLSLFLAGITVVGAARAEDVTTVYLAGTCVPNGTSASEIFHMLEAEIAPVRLLPFTDARAMVAGEAILGVDGCTDAPLGARVSIVHDGQRRERFVTLSDIAPDALDRTFSLALAEASRDPNYTQPVGQVRPVPPPAPPVQLSVQPVVPVQADSPAPKTQASAVAPRAALLFRFMPGSSTPALGVDVGLQYSRLSAGLMVLGGHGTDTLGTVTLVAIAGTAAYDVLDLGASVTVRVAGELGVAMGIPAPNESSVGHAKVAPHAALQGGLAASLPLGAGYDLQGFIGGGYGSSLNAEADGRRVASLGGGILSIAAGVRFP